MSRSIAHVFEERRVSTPDLIALTGNEELTYSQLASSSDRIASWLVDRGVGRGQRVGLYARRSREAISAILGILKSGAAYVPLDPSYPPRLLRDIHDDSLPSITLAQDSLLHEGSLEPFSTDEVAGFDSVLKQTMHAHPDGGPSRLPEISGEDAACIMYTAGAAGRHQGVVVPHRAVLRLVLEADYVHLGPDEVILQLAPLSFDASTFEIWGALLNGGSLAVLSNPRPSLADVAAAINEFGVTTMSLTAGLFHLMVDHCVGDLQPLRQLLAAGGVLSPAHVASARRSLPRCRLISGYGPAENTTLSCCYTVPPDYDGARPVPIGRPIHGTEALVLDDTLHSVSQGEEGELYVGGAGLALGYFNHPELTAERFIRHPFDPAPSARLYRTGDRVRALADGSLEFLGHADRQAKVSKVRMQQIVVYVTDAEPSRNGEKAGSAESTLMEIWRRVLRRSDVGLDDSFFDLGGTSLQLLEVHAVVRRTLGREVSVLEMFQNPSIRALAMQLSSRSAWHTDRIAPRDRLRRALGDPGRHARSRLACSTTLAEAIPRALPTAEAANDDGPLIAPPPVTPVTLRAPLRARDGWDPFEVWRTRVLAGSKRDPGGKTS